MEHLATALVPPFVVAFVIQHIVEIIDQLILWLIDLAKKTDAYYNKHKRLFLEMLSVMFALLFVMSLAINIVNPSRSPNFVECVA